MNRFIAALIFVLLVVAICALMAAATVGTVNLIDSYAHNEDDPIRSVEPQVKCPEDADLIVRYSVEPAGIYAWCMSSDTLEEILP